MRAHTVHPNVMNKQHRSSSATVLTKQRWLDAIGSSVWRRARPLQMRQGAVIAPWQTGGHCGANARPSESQQAPLAGPHPAAASHLHPRLLPLAAAMGSVLPQCLEITVSVDLPNSAHAEPNKYDHPAPRGSAMGPLRWDVTAVPRGQVLPYDNRTQADSLSQ
ncbi:hypothetical protein WOLCODRAFT_165678 [Wolfiporia cocos MD-104 SS10]|uniref:Uncharacterized protein n=1 Tax=Wolfiporia cocos (strain MD-104) TaxID=742152 RepID=A0A2H3IX68_WOLCO|nr:hypothetical protein WOLCODRAFT_165678 [Wolfiporia cocos MD-104 SS10]